MRLSQAWIVTRHDLRLLRERKTILATLVGFPIAVAVGFPLLVRYILAHTSAAVHAGSYLPGLIDSFSFWFVIGGVSVPVAIASYSIVGEKLEKSLEPLLATPTTDGEILLGKTLAAFLPTVIAVLAAAVVFMVLIDRVTGSALGYAYYPNPTMDVLLAGVTPLSVLVSIEATILVSSRATDVRTVQQSAGLLFLPFILLYLAGEIGVLDLDATTLLEIAAILGAACLGLFFLTVRTFDRNEILTRWR